MFRKKLLGLLTCVVFTMYPYGTTVHLHNNTPFTFAITVEQKGSSLSTSHWSAYQKTINPYQSANIVGIGRNVGIKNEKEYIFISTLKAVGTPSLNEGQSIILAQRLKGKVVGSKMWWGLSCGQFDNVWYDKNDMTWNNPKSCCLKSPKGDIFVQVKYKSHYWAGKKDPYDDITYVFSMPDAPSKARYDQGYYLTAHNAFATTKQGYTFAQQSLSILDQLRYGARGLMLDTYEKDGKVVLVHGGFDVDKWIHPGKGPRPLVDLLKEIDLFLKSNPQAIISIFLENYVKSGQLLTDAFKDLNQYLFTPSNFNAQGGRWPSLEWMRKNNKRIIVFCPNGLSVNFFDEWRYHIENQFSTVDIKGASAERGSSRRFTSVNRTLYVFNFFAEFKITAIAGTALQFESINGKKLREALEYAMTQGLDGQRYKGLKPNFIALDFIEKGDGLDIISKWNGAFV